MTDVNFTASLNKPIHRDYLSDAYVLLGRANGIVDLLFTFSANSQIEGLCEGTLTNSLDAIYFLIAEANELIICGCTNKSEPEASRELTQLNRWVREFYVFPTEKYINN